MNPYLARASGYDFANLWMNLAKVLIIFLFVYQQILETQLGISLFQGGFYIFDSNDADDQENRPIQVVTHDDPLFSINFLPLSTTTSYDHVRLKVYQVSGQEGPLPLNEEKSIFRFLSLGNSRPGESRQEGGVQYEGNHSTPGRTLNGSLHGQLQLSVLD